MLLRLLEKSPRSDDRLVCRLPPPCLLLFSLPSFLPLSPVFPLSSLLSFRSPGARRPPVPLPSRPPPTAHPGTTPPAHQPFSPPSLYTRPLHPPPRSTVP